MKVEVEKNYEEEDVWLKKCINVGPYEVHKQLLFTGVSQWT